MRRGAYGYGAPYALVIFFSPRQSRRPEAIAIEEKWPGHLPPNGSLRVGPYSGIQGR
jgi:hypothetical protein